jgi:hypothetical protein
MTLRTKAPAERKSQRQMPCSRCSCFLVRECWSFNQNTATIPVSLALSGAGVPFSWEPLGDQLNSEPNDDYDNGKNQHVSVVGLGRKWSWKNRRRASEDSRRLVAISEETTHNSFESSGCWRLEET